MKKALFILICILSITLIGCKKEEDFVIKGETSIEIGFASEYKAYYNNEEISPDDVYWIVDNKEVVSRVGNVLTGVSNGTVNLKAVLKEDSTKYASINVKVVDSVVESIELRNAKTSIDVGEQFIVSINTTPSDAIENIKTKWTTDVDGIVEVDGADDSAIITGIKEGTVTITAKCSSATQSFTLDVIKPITEITMYNDYELSKESTLCLSFNIDDAVVEVLTDNLILEDNYLYGLNSGVGKIKVTSKGNKKLAAKEIEINVVEENQKAAEITSEERKIIDSYMNNMSLSQKIGQMLMINFSYTNSGWRRVEYAFSQDDNGSYYYGNKDESNKVYIKDLLSNYPFGNFAFNQITSPNEASVGALALGMQNYFISNNKIGGIIALASSGYRNQMGEGFNTYNSNLTLGTINKISNAKKQYEALASDLSDTGVNMYITGCYSLTSSTLDEYSAIQDKQVIYSSVLNNTLSNKNISVTPIFGITKNGIGESINSTNNKLIASAVNDNIQSIVITNTSTYKSTNSITAQQYLRNLGYNGLIVDAEVHYDNTQRYYYSEKESEYNFYYNKSYYVDAINNGTDILTFTIYLENEVDRWNYRYIARNSEVFNFINSLEECVTNGEISIETINKSVERILLYKIRNGVIEGTYPMDDYKKNSTNQNIVNNIKTTTNVLSSEGKFTAIDKKNKVAFFYESGEVNTAIVNSSVFKKGYTNLSRYQLTSDNTFNVEDNGIKAIDSDTTAVIFVEGTSFEYAYDDFAYDKNGNIQYDESGNAIYKTYYQSMTYVDLVNEIKSKTSKIILVFLNDPQVGKLFTDIDCFKVYCNYEWSSSIPAVLDVFEKNNATGVTLNNK